MSSRAALRSVGLNFRAYALVAIFSSACSGFESSGNPPTGGKGGATGGVSSASGGASGGAGLAGGGADGARGGNRGGAASSGASGSGASSVGGSSGAPASGGNFGAQGGTPASETGGSETGGSKTSGGRAGAGPGGAPSGGGGTSGAAGASGSAGSNGGGPSLGGGGAGGSAGASCKLTLPAAISTHLTVGVHDPAMLRAGSNYYLLATGGRLTIRSSTDLRGWKNSATIFSTIPSWIATALGETITELWAPDISFYGGIYHVYYAGSTFGSNHSVIGLVTNTTLNPEDAGYKWEDRGLVLESNKAGGSADDWNAIDPNLTFDQSGQPWLVFGSFWSGIKLRKVDAATGKLSSSDTKLYSLAKNSSIEAASIVYHNGYYYLFVSYGACCKGADSTYSTMAGRATAITGPYTNKAGQDMMQGRAETMLTTVGRYVGPGGGTAFQDCDRYFYAYHYYDGQANGASYLMLRPINWSNDDWPVMGEPLWQ